MNTKHVWMVLLIVLTGSIVSGQTLAEQALQVMIPGADMRNEMAAPGECVAELTVKETMLKMVDYAGNVVKVEFDDLFSFRQVETGYMGAITYKSHFLWDSIVIRIPKEGLDFFSQDLDEEGRKPRKVYVQISRDGILSRAIGTRVRRSEEYGFEYFW